MAKPDSNRFADAQYERLAPSYGYADSQNDWPLLTYLIGISLMFTDIQDIVDPENGDLPWTPVLDVDTTPIDWLGWLAQFLGSTLRPGLDEAAQRTRISSTDGMHRGTPSALAAAARQYLMPIGDVGYVIINERVGGDAYLLGIRTLTAETPDEALVLDALLEQKPGGVILDYDAVAGQTYDTLRIAFDSYADVLASNQTYADLMFLP